MNLICLGYPLDGWFEHHYLVVTLVWDINVAIVVYRKAMWLVELPIYSIIATPFAQEIPLGIEDLDPIITVFWHVKIAFVIHCQALRLTELPVSFAADSPFAEEVPMWVEDLNPIIALIGYVYVTGTVKWNTLRSVS